MYPSGEDGDGRIDGTSRRRQKRYSGKLWGGGSIPAHIVCTEIYPSHLRHASCPSPSLPRNTLPPTHTHEAPHANLPGLVEPLPAIAMNGVLLTVSGSYMATRINMFHWSNVCNAVKMCSAAGALLVPAVEAAHRIGQEGLR